MGIEYSKYPICDTNMIIDLSLGNILKRFLNAKRRVWICDKVLLELKFKFQNSDKYSGLAELNSKMNLIGYQCFSEQQLNVMKLQLLNYEIQNCIGTKNIGKDFGEFVSAIYAVTLGIKELYTNDKTFIREYKCEPIFKNLIMKNLDETLRELLSDRERIKTMSIIESENEKMKRILKDEKEKDKLDKMLNLLRQKYT